ncbi:hypothetical protein NVP1121O_085 [Vibrio phage 1.121.O._10N.286.46.C4]|nr:hypothetical protein NVP1121O_085 [Vibrio phage 1.121.O._10N.286.46.C4]
MDYSGHSFVNQKGNTVMVLKRVGKRYSSPLYSMVCSHCSEDSDLWGEVFIPSTSIKKRRSPCGCTETPRWTEKQNLTRINRIFDDKGYIFEGWAGSYTGRCTKVKVYNPATGNRWSSSSLESLLDGVNDPALSGRGDEKFQMAKFPYSEDYTVRKDDSLAYYWRIYCTICDMEFSLYQSQAVRGIKSCTCANNKVRKEDQETEAITLAKLKGSTVVGKINYTSRKKTKVTWLCENGHLNKCSYENFMSRHSCTSCSDNGFNPAKPANFYIVRWSEGYESYLKYGITNREVNTRLSEQKTHAKLTPEILCTFHHESGQLVWDCEKSIKQSMQTGMCPKELLPDGYTETVLDTEDNLRIILAKVNEYLK